jgi:hypothetical protein
MSWYVGHKQEDTTKLEAFQSDYTPTMDSHGKKYAAVIGPFATKRGAKWAEKYGASNPHFQQVADAERLAVIAEKEGWQ